MAENKNALLESFKSRQSEKNTLASQEALRLVNLYRSLSYFNSEFVDKYNQMLLSTSSAVQRLLHTFMGGEEVESYLEFLRQNSHLSDTKSEQQQNFENQIKGYLPQPESDINSGKNSAEKFVVSRDEWDKLKQEQRLLQDRLHQLLKVQSEGKTDFNSKSFKKYSEIIEESSEDKPNE